MAQHARSHDTGNVTRFPGALSNGEFGQFMFTGADTLFATFARNQSEMLDFIVMRLEKDGELIQELAGCRNWSDALAVQSRWVQEMIRDYMEEAPKLLAFSITTERQGRTVGRGR